MDRLRIETGLGTHDQRRLTAAVAQRELPAVLEGGTLVMDLEVGRQVSVWVERLLRFNRRIHALAAREGKPIPSYKPRDMADLYHAVLAGVAAGDVAAIAHEVIWRQPFPNANHRTVVAALLEFGELVADESTVRAATEATFLESKRLLDGSKKLLPDHEAKLEHLAAVRAMWERIQSIK